MNTSLLKLASLFWFSLIFFSSTAAACSIVSSFSNIPPDRLEAHKKALKTIDIDISEPTKGTKKYYQQLYDKSRYVYVGRVKLILDKSDRADEAKHSDSLFAYVKVSEGWKSGKTRDIRLVLPKNNNLCDNKYDFQLTEKLKYLFFENQKGLITALPINKNTKSDRFSAEAMELYGEPDWYYSRNTTIHYNSKK